MKSFTSELEKRYTNNPASLRGLGVVGKSAYDLRPPRRGAIEAKWGRPWQPHTRRPSAAYEDLKQQILLVLARSTPLGAAVLIVSKGDEDWLRRIEAEGRRPGHFPQDQAGAYTGFYPADSQAAIVHLEELRGRGSDFLVFPRPATWWLDHYRELKEHLEIHYRQVVCLPDVCVIYALQERGIDHA